MVKEMPSSTVASRDEECLRKSLMEVVKSDSSSICRLCLSKEQKLTRVFEDESGIDDALLKKILDCTSVKVKLKDIYPSAICAVCDLKLNDFYKFREKCIENNMILHNLLGAADSAGFERGACENRAKDNEEQEDQAHDSEQKQQAATSTTVNSVGTQNESTVAIALNQLSELGLRTMLDSSTNRKDEEADMTGTIRVAKNLLANEQHDESGRNIVSSSWGASVQAQSESKAHSTNSKRTYVLAAMEMAAGVNLRGGGREGKYECKECRRTFRNAYTLRRHNNLHTRTNLFPCEYCGKKFNDRSNWKIHQRSHTGDNLYTCLVCLKTFISPSTLKYHLRSHRRLESFDCRVCHNTFVSYEQLEEHARNLHQQHVYMGMEDFSSDGDHLIDAARFVKIELEDGELPSSMADISATSGCKSGMMTRSLGDDGDCDDEEDAGLPDDNTFLQDETNRRDQQHADGENNLPRKAMGSSLGQGDTIISHAQVAQLMEQRRQQLLEQVLQKQQQMNKDAAQRTTEDMAPAIKQETASDGDVIVKEEPQDDSFEMDPSELLHQAMEEADADDQDKDRSSSTSSSPSTVIMFRCDYCMKIFHYLDELNAHMVLHNGMKAAVGNSALVLGTLDSTASVDISPNIPLAGQVMQTNEHASLQQLMMKKLTACLPIPSLEESTKGSAETAPSLYPAMRQMQLVYRRTDGAYPIVAATKRRRNAFQPDPADVVNAPPPEHPCSKCSKMFRTEELRRVHEATHANDELTNKVRSCRFCSKVFKCELNLLAHLRKHHSTTSESEVGAGCVDSAGSGNDESCSSAANLANRNAKQQPVNSTSSASGHSELLLDVNGATSDGDAGSSSSYGGQKSVERRCEICAISFIDTVMLEKHVLSHFERNEAVAFVPSTDRPFKCTECHKRFKRKDYLLIHIRTHTGERRYKCDLCSSAFVHPSNLITHRKLHSNERPHKCNLCSATFKLFAGLKIHRRRCEQKLPN